LRTNPNLGFCENVGSGGPLHRDSHYRSSPAELEKLTMDSRPQPIGVPSPERSGMAPASSGCDPARREGPADERRQTRPLCPLHHLYEGVDEKSGSRSRNTSLQPWATIQSRIAMASGCWCSNERERYVTRPKPNHHPLRLVRKKLKLDTRNRVSPRKCVSRHRRLARR
jgi:hypothetical protein